MAMKSLSDLYIHFLRDILYAEKAGLKAMRAMARKAESDELKSLIEEHREETEGQIENLEKAFELLAMRARGARCEAMDGIVEEAKDLMDEAQDGPTRDAGIIAAMQAAEHYEITRYGTLIAWAKQLGHTEAMGLFQKNLDQESAADKKLSKLATKHLNEKAEALAA